MALPWLDLPLPFSLSLLAFHLPLILFSDAFPPLSLLVRGCSLHSNRLRWIEDREGRRLVDSTSLYVVPRAALTRSAPPRLCQLLTRVLLTAHALTHSRSFQVSASSCFQWFRLLLVVVVLLFLAAVVVVLLLLQPRLLPLLLRLLLLPPPPLPPPSLLLLLSS